MAVSFCMVFSLLYAGGSGPVKEGEMGNDEIGSIFVPICRHEPQRGKTGCALRSGSSKW